MQAATHDFSRNTAPKELMDAQGRPAAPLLPRVNDSTVLDPIKAVRAAISTNPDPSVVEITISQTKGCFRSYIVRGLLLRREVASARKCDGAGSWKM